MRDHLFHLPRDSSANLQGQVREMLVAAILDGHIPAGSPLPSCRRLAGQLGVARNTVVLAYQRLVDEGYLQARERSGFYVSSDILSRRPGPAPAGPSRPAPDWSRTLRMHPSKQRNVVRPRDWHDYRYPFVYGQLDPALFPLADWRECCRQALSVLAVRDWAADSIDGDDPYLIEQIRTRVLPRRGVRADADEILVTVGAQQALYLTASLLLDTRRRIAIEDPGYVDARNIFLLKTPHVVPVEVDGNGMVPDRRIRRAHCVYVTPSQQSPTTVTMPLARRLELLEFAHRHGLIVIEDDYESDYCWRGEPLPALKSLDNGDRVVYIGSLSKTLAPGLRLGYMVGPREFIREARTLRRLMLRHPPANNQRTVALFLAQGLYDALVRRLTHAYRDRWQTLARALATHLPELTVHPPAGGTAWWIPGPAHLDTRELARAAAAESILIETGDIHFLRPEPPLNYFRLAFSSIPADRIDPGVERLASLIRHRH